MSNESRALRLSVERAGKSASYEVHGGIALVGSGSHCDIRLLPEDAAIEQLRIELRGAELYAEVLSLEHECRVNGVPFRQGLLSPEVPLKLGYATVHVQIAQTLDRKKSGKSEGWPPAVRVLGFGSIAVGLYMSLQTPPAVSLLDKAVEHPALFGDAVTECATRGDQDAMSYARRLIREANLQSERAPFYPRDGVSAVTRYEEAAVCLTRDGRAQEAKAATRAADALRQTLADQFHVRHVRLERYLSIKKYDAAQREVHVLQDFLNRREGAYAQWLSAVQRELNMRFASAKRKG
jgi:hypothetical protein